MGKEETDSVIARIKETMKELGISQLLLSDTTGISRSNLYYILKKKVSPTLDTLDRIADAMEVNMAEFFKPSRHYIAMQNKIAKAEKRFLNPAQPDLVQQWLLLHPEVAEEYGVDTSSFPGAKRFLKKIEEEKAKEAKTETGSGSSDEKDSGETKDKETDQESKDGSLNEGISFIHVAENDAGYSKSGRKKENPESGQNDNGK